MTTTKLFFILNLIARRDSHKAAVLHPQFVEQLQTSSPRVTLEILPDSYLAYLLFKIQNVF
jgi:hypothetical protein